MTLVTRESIDGDVDHIKAEPKTKPLPKGIWRTALDGEEVVAMMGLVPVFPGRAVLMYLTDQVRPFALSKLLKELLATPAGQSFERIEAMIEYENEPMQRFIDLHGFINETPNGMGKFMFGKTYTCWARVT